MSDFFLDTSALVKRYVQETGSRWIANLFDQTLKHEIFVAVITPVELISAITRRSRAGNISPSNTLAALSNFKVDLMTQYQEVNLTPGVISTAIDLAEKHGLRGYDAVQLAAALETNTLLVANGLPPLIFVSADSNLNIVASLTGLTVENPNDYS